MNQKECGKFLKIRTLFSDRERSIKALKELYNNSFLSNEIRDILGEKFLTSVLGKRVFLKPNWVRHSMADTDTICLRTHDDFVLAVLEVILQSGAKSVLIGDAPVQSCDWDTMHSAEFVVKMYRLGEKYRIPVEVKDFRRVIFDPKENKEFVDRNPMSEYLIFDIGKKSCLEDVTKSGKFRITSYSPERLKKAHSKGRHCYCVVKELFESDIVLSLPKIKTHQKAGITAALKNLVGVNGDKDYLPHHRIGGSKLGGDCYPGGNILRRIAEFFLDIANYNHGNSLYRVCLKISSFFWKVSMPQKVHQLAAGWYGNDTVWRMVMDLNLIIKYGNKNGVLSDVPQRDIYSLCDGIIGGQGNGPLEPEPLPLGIISFSNSSELNDWGACLLLGFDPEKIPLIKYAKDSLLESDYTVYVNGKEESINVLSQYFIKTHPSPGWEDYLK